MLTYIHKHHNLAFQNEKIKKPIVFDRWLHDGLNEHVALSNSSLSLLCNHKVKDWSKLVLSCNRIVIVSLTGGYKLYIIQCMKVAYDKAIGTYIDF